MTVLLIRRRGSLTKPWLNVVSDTARARVPVPADACVCVCEESGTGTGAVKSIFAGELSHTNTHIHIHTDAHAEASERGRNVGGRGEGGRGGVAALVEGVRERGEREAERPQILPLTHHVHVKRRPCTENHKRKSARACTRCRRQREDIGRSTAAVAAAMGVQVTRT